MSLSKKLTTTAILLALAGPAAAMTATATTDLNMRTGPGPEFPVNGVILSSGEVVVEGCIANSSWCKVAYDGQEGWASASYLSTQYEEQPVVVYDNVEQLQIPSVVYEVPVGERHVERIDDKTTLHYDAPKILVAPSAAASGSALVPLVPQPQDVTYILQNPVNPVYLDGQVVVGAGVPQNVQVYEVPNAQYQYLNVNDQVVLVEPENRRIVQVLR